MTAQDKIPPFPVGDLQASRPRSTKFYPLIRKFSVFRFAASFMINSPDEISALLCSFIASETVQTGSYRDNQYISAGFAVSFAPAAISPIVYRSPISLSSLGRIPPVNIAVRMVSKYSKYYGVDKNDPSRLMCLMCHITMKKAPRNATSGLRRHLATHHREQFMELTRLDEVRAMEMTEEAHKSLQLCKDTMMDEARLALPMCGESMDPLDSMCSQWSTTESEEPSQLNKAVLRCIVEEGIPISFFDSPAAQDLLSLANGGQYSLPSSNHFVTVEIPEAYDKLKGAISKSLSECPSISITAHEVGEENEGSSKYITLIVHWLTDHFERKKAFLKATPKIPNILEHAEKVLTGVPLNKLLFLLHGESIEGSEDIYRNKMTRIDGTLFRGFDVHIDNCFDNILCDMEGWSETYKSLQGICEFLQGTTLAKEDYIVCLQLAGLFDTFKKNTRDTWSSKYQLCEQLLDAQPVIEHLLVKYNEMPSLKPSDWEKIAMVKKILKPYSDAAKIIHYSTDALVSTVVPFLRVLLKGFDVNKNSDLKEQDMAATLSQLLEIDSLNVATVLDPRFKLNFILDEKITSMKETILTYMKEFARIEKGETPIQLGMREVKSEQGQLQWLMAGTSNSDNSLPLSFAKELELYLSEQEDINIDPLVYWRLNKHRFPNVAGLARGYLSSLANDVDTENLISAAKIVSNAMGSESSPQTFEKLLLLKFNSGLFPSKYNADLNIF